MAEEVTKERVPESHIARVKARPMWKMPPMSDNFAADNPKLRASLQAGIDHIDYLVDMEQDCLRQHAEKGYAEVGVVYIRGIKRMFILPQPQPQAMMNGGGEVMMNGGAGRSSKTKLVFVSGLAMMFALLVVLLSFPLTTSRVV